MSSGVLGLIGFSLLIIAMYGWHWIAGTISLGLFCMLLAWAANDQEEKEKRNKKKGDPYDR